MPVVDVVNLEGKKVGQVELADAVFGAKVNPYLLHEASRWYLRGLRAGTHKTKALRSVLDKLNSEKSSLLVSHGENRNLELASRNLDRVKLVASNVLQPYDLLNHDKLFVSKEAAARLSHSLDPERVAVAAPAAGGAETTKPAKKEVAPRAAAKHTGKKEKASAKKAAKPKSKGKK
jgi:ribosomal protein L4